MESCECNPSRTQEGDSPRVSMFGTALLLVLLAHIKVYRVGPKKIEP